MNEEKKPRAIGRDALDWMRCACGEAGCAGTVYLHSKCHPRAKLEVCYRNGEIILLCGDIICRDYKTEVMRIAVAETSATPSSSGE